MPSVSTSSNPELAHQIIQATLADIEAEQTSPEVQASITSPPETVFSLPGGYENIDGSVYTEIEVRELTGRDEEAIAKTKSSSAMTDQILKRGVVRIGDSPASTQILDNMLSGDRDFALLKIFEATFGSTLNVSPFCESCGSQVEVELDVDKDVPIKTLESPSDRYFEVNCRKGTAKVTLPTGITQKALQDANNKTYSELSTVLLANTVLSVNGRQILTEQDVLDLPIRDRRAISDELAKRTPGPRLRDVTATCPNCEAVLEVPLSLSALFQF